MTELDHTETRLVNAATGEVLDLSGESADELAGSLNELDQLVGALRDTRGAIVDELARRLDARGTRKAIIDGVELETNAPSEEHYDPDELRRRLDPLVATGVIDQALVDSLIVTPAPKLPEPRVDRRRVNTLKRSTDRRLLAALSAARTVKPTTRTVKVLGRLTDTTAEEE